MNKKVRTVILDDSVFFTQFLATALKAEPYLDIIEIFNSPAEALNKIPELNPDILIIDMEMPHIKGGEFIKSILSKNPNLKALAVSSIESNSFIALHAGAVDFVCKPNALNKGRHEDFLKEVLTKIKAICASMPKSTVEPGGENPADSRASKSLSSVHYSGLSANSSQSVIVIGASTGGTEAIIKIVQEFPQNTPPVLIVQHMPPVFTGMFAERLDKICKMSAKEAANGDRLKKGNILVAPGDLQMTLNLDYSGYYVNCLAGEKVSGHCPSVDVLFESVARIAKQNAVGVILTGMGSDGAASLLKMRQAGAYTIGQDKDSCIVYGMPMAAKNIGAVVKQAPLSEIAPLILSCFSL